MRNYIKNYLFISFLTCYLCQLSRAYDEMDKRHEKRQLKDIEALRNEIFKSRQVGVGITREKSTERLAEINVLKDNILSSNQPFQLSTNLTNWLKEGSSAGTKNLEIMVEEAISDPNINIIDEHVKEIVNPNVLNNFQPDYDEIKVLAKMKHSESSINNLYRENLKIDVIKEQTNFRIGINVEKWKTISLEKSVALIGRSNNSIILVIGSDDTYRIVNKFKIEEAKNNSMCIETFTIWDNTLNKMRNIILIGVDGSLIWYEIVNEKDMIEIYRWRLMKTIDKLEHIHHDGSNLLMITMLDELGRAEMQFIEFDFENQEFWVVQSLKLSKLPLSMTFVDAGRDLIVAFTQEDNVSVYRRQNHERSKFSFLKSIDAPNVGAIIGFRIGGHSYLAIGGDHPQILRYSNHDFVPQTILSQTFGHVEKFLAIPIKIYRDDLVLLVQHSIKFRTHSLTTVDALIWNGIAFESALSIPCQITADPNANGFTCILDIEREEGLLGASFVVTEKNNSFYIVIPRHEAHSGLFKVEYGIVEAEDPLMKEIENVKRAIELINGMLDLEMSVKQQVEDALNTTVNPKQKFEFKDIDLEEIDANIIHFDGNVTLETDRIEFIDMSYSREDFMVDLEEIERTLIEDEEKIKEIDAHLNMLIRRNRQTPAINQQHEDSPVHYLGPYTYNGQFDAKTLRVIPQNNVKRPRRKRQVDPIDETRLDNLKVDDISVKNINGIPIEDFLFLDENGVLNVPSTNIVFEESIHVENVFMKNNGKVNGIDFRREVLAIDSPYFPKSLTFDKLVADYTFINKLNGIPVDLTSLKNISTNFDADVKLLSTKEAFMHQNIKVRTVNGVDWKDLMSQIILINNPSSMENLTVNGNVIFVDYGSALNIQTLNGLSFPNDYVLMTGPTETLISGSKTFTKKLYTKAIDTDGTINEIYPSSIITLDQPQEISGDTTFNSVEVSGRLEVHGTISGKKLDEFLPNPSLEHSKEILADCTFKELIVEGVVKVENSLNGQDIATILADVVYEGNNESEIVVTGPKTFNNLVIQQNTKVTSNYINDVSIDNIMTTIDDQIVKIEKFSGEIHFTNLKLFGLFDGINATDLEMNSIRTFGDQFIQTPLLISNHLSAKSIDVKNSLNDVKSDEYFFIDESIEFPSQVKVGMFDVTVENIKIDKDIVGNGELEGIDLEDLDQNRLSKSIEQKIVHPVKVDKLVVDKLFEGKTINGVDFEIFKRYLMDLKNFKSNLLSGKQKLENIVIDGNVILNTWNDKDFEHIKNHVVWLNRPNVLTNSLLFLDEVEVQGSLTVNNLNGKNMTSFLENWVSKNESPIKISSNKAVKSLMVEQNLELSKINKIPYENLLKKQDVVESQFLNLVGTLTVDKLYVKNKFNHQEASVLENLYLYDKETRTHTINGNVKLISNANIYNLNTAYLDKLNVNTWLADLIKVDENDIICKGKVFKAPIKFQNGANIKTMNELNLKDLMDNVIILKDNEIINVNSSIFFLDDFYAELVGLRGNLTTDFMNGLDLNEWILSAYPIHKDVYFEDIMFADSALIKFKNLTVSMINGIPFNSFLTLHSNQTIDHHVTIYETDAKSFIVNGLVNLMNLKKEYENTVMISEKEQLIETKVIMTDVLVLDSVTVKGLINSKNIEKIARLDSSLNFDSSLTFNNLQVSSVHSNDRISSINFTKWYDNAIWKNGREVQHVSGNWKLKTAQFTDDVTGNGLINGQPVIDIEKNLNKNVNEIEMALSNYSVEYRSMCQKLQYRADDYAKNSIYVLKYFEEAFKIIEEVSIFSYYLFDTSDNRQYLFVNTNCTTNIYKWIKHEESFVKLSSYETGVVYNWYKLESKINNNELFIITNSKMVANAPCTYGGTNTWKFVDDKLMHVAPISSEADILELYIHPSNSKSFYALFNADVVATYDVFGKKIESWGLPYDNFTYSFVSSDILAGLNVNNGRKIFSLDTKFLKGRKHRSVDQNASLLSGSRAKVHPDDSPTYSIRKPEFPSFATIPTIPSKQVTTTKKVDFISKMKDAGEVIRRSFTMQTTSLSSKYSKLDRFNETDSNKLTFVFKSPNMTDVHQKMITQNLIVKKDINEDIKMQEQMTDIKNPLEISPNDTIVEATTQGQEILTEATTATEKFLFTPRVIMPDDDDDNNTKNEIEKKTDGDKIIEIDNALLKSQPIVDSVTVVNGKGVRSFENFVIPEHGHGEIIYLDVGTEKNKKPLYVISRKRTSVIQGNNMIEIYSDIINGNVFQYIVCTDPSNILALRFRDETLLAFLESRREVKVYIYRGIQGFTLFKSISLPDYTYQMSTFTLPSSIQYKCDHRFLVFHFEKELLFMNVVVDGNCGLSHIECDEF